MTEKPEIEFELVASNGQRVTCVACGGITGNHPFTALAHESGAQVAVGARAV